MHWIFISFDITRCINTALDNKICNTFNLTKLITFEDSYTTWWLFKLFSRGSPNNRITAVSHRIMRASRLGIKIFIWILYIVKSCRWLTNVSDKSIASIFRNMKVESIFPPVRLWPPIWHRISLWKPKPHSRHQNECSDSPLATGVLYGRETQSFTQEHRRRATENKALYRTGVSESETQERTDG